MTLVRSLLCALLMMTGPLFSNVTDNTEQPVQIEIIHEETTVQPNRPFWIALRLKVTDGWHIYWKNPGDTGMAPIIDWKLPQGFNASPMNWPTPEKFISNDLIGYGYKGEVFLLTQVTPSLDTTDKKSIEIGAQVRWLACSESLCLPGESEANAKISVSHTMPTKHSSWGGLFDTAKKKIPQFAEALAYQLSDSIELHFDLPEFNDHDNLTAYFFPEENGVLLPNKEEIQLTLKEGSTFVLPLKASLEGKAKSLKGIALVNGKHAIEIDTPLINQEQQQTPQMEDSSLLLAIALAFLGGFILNLMPCVLPVISFKVLSFVKMAGQQRSLIFKHGIAFTIGVLVSFWALAICLLILKASGNAVGWGFQLQEPFFVALLAGGLFAFALNLFGVFEIGSFMLSLASKAQGSNKKEGLFSSFLSGVLATALATPCTGPFLGSAVGFALSASYLSAMLIFTFLGLGMSLPYLMLAAFPRLLKFMPRPGEWMVTFKEIMGFIMMATVLWLIWVFNAQTNQISLMLFLISLFFIAVAGWVFGKWGIPTSSRVLRRVSMIFAVAFIVWSGYLMHVASSPAVLAMAPSEDTNQEIAWEKFSPERVNELQAKGVPVLIDFTAKWCLICQANHLILSTKNVENKMNELGVVRMKADWTKNDAIITEELKKFGRSGVPLYVLYAGDPEQSPEILPQVLTPDIVIDYLKVLE